MKTTKGWRREVRWTLAVCCAVAVIGFASIAPGRTQQNSTPPLSNFKYQFKIGVLPFVDNTGSGGEDLGPALSRAVQAEFTHSTDLEGRVVPLPDGTAATDVDDAKAVEIGRGRKVDVVLVGTVLEASSEQTSKSGSGPSFGGISVGGSASSMKATVTLQGDIYSTTTGKKIDSIRVTGNDSETHLGTDVSTDLGGLSNGGAAFDNAPIGKALHKAVADLAKKIAAEESSMTRYQPDASGGSQTPPAQNTSPNMSSADTAGATSAENAESSPPPEQSATTQGGAGSESQSTASASGADATASPPAQPASSSACSALAPSEFGSQQKTAVSMEGKIYFLPEDTGQLPTFDPATSKGSIYAEKWNVPEQDFTNGFPGVTDRYEWFALDYQGSIYVPVAGQYGFRLSSDDGSKM